jgi:hypothetical protein
MEDLFDFESMTKEQIEAAIVRNVREMKKLREDKKDFATATNEALKEIETRVDAALEALDKK